MTDVTPVRRPISECPLDEIVEEVLDTYTYEQVAASVKRVLARRTERALGKSAGRIAETLSKIITRGS